MAEMQPKASKHACTTEEQHQENTLNLQAMAVSAERGQVPQQDDDSETTSTRSATPDVKQSTPQAPSQQMQATPGPGVTAAYVPVFENAMLWQERDVDPPCLKERVITPQLWDAKNTSIDMRIFVHNLGFEKDVFVRYTEDGWASFKDVHASFVRKYMSKPANPTPPIDIFLVTVPVEPRAHKIELCFGYTVGGQTHWNNNDGSNFRLRFAEVPKDLARIFGDNIRSHEDCIFCNQMEKEYGMCPVCFEPETLLFPSAFRWYFESWDTPGCPERHVACRECLFRWYGPQVLAGAKHLRCIGGCGTKAMAPDVHVVDRLLGCLFMHNQRISHASNLQEMKANEDLWSWLRDYTTTCPSCDLPVEREEGCNAMLCHCGASFCFMCGQLLDTSVDCDCSEEDEYFY